ncbi:ATP-binding cassette domain-containing protein [Jeotgalibaca sp. MA1X17-3]|uniref:ATP-binding cassette domain-containing protein n=1 Tax=Jeotgalibaca sp. MA1X17-3 TaxID=2908211 RepID=UPI001F2B5ABA|nr:ATP-binding cassette domain-containing protein [Jeotgalibaca sp. MA1X17-3]UJF16498.1 ATP-binding cassette domain-containing protein [Jeotgalibaca sp. MA1X17-3]
MEFNRRSPVYEQIITYFKERIANGEYKPGSDVPSRRELAVLFKINPNTAQRAYKEMEEQGLIYTEGNSPSRITEDRSTIQMLRKDMIHTALDDFIAVIKPMGLEIQDIIPLLQKKYGEEKKMIELRDVHKSFKNKNVLKGISFSIKPNEVTCITGLNGTGKTTLMNSIMQLNPIDKGEILLDGKKLTHQSFEKISYIPDTLKMPGNMNIQEAMNFMEIYYQNWNKDKATELISFFKLNPDEKLKDYSKGNQAKINFLLGLSLDADYFLMDEPLSGVDMFAREQILEVFTSNLITNKGVLLATHHIEEVEFLLDRVVMLQMGAIQKDFYAEEIRETEGKSIIDVMREVYQS